MDGSSHEVYGGSKLELALGRISWQSAVFAAELRWPVLRSLNAFWPMQKKHVHVLRNDPFELVARLWSPFLAFSGFDVDISYGPYDESLSAPLSDSALTSDAIVVWLDYEHHSHSSPEQHATWVVDRLDAIRERYDCSILLANWGATHERAKAFNLCLTSYASKVPGLSIADQASLARALGSSYESLRTETMTGCRLSSRAILETARHFGLKWLPVIFGSSIKGIVVDLDDTLYRGTLGEVGSDGVDITEQHIHLGDALLKCRRNGIFLAICSRNHPEDVDDLFRRRNDLVVRPEHVSAMAVGWGPKSTAIHSIAAQLRTTPESMLFVDDNLGELAEAFTMAAGINCLHSENPALTTMGIEYFPGLHSFKTTEVAALRIRDHKAMERRAKALAIGSTSEPPSFGLDVRIQVYTNPKNERNRLAELSNRTNQFNTGLFRFDEVKVDKYLRTSTHCVIGLGLKDRFSDSGVVGAAFAHREATDLVVDEIALSCRALGRGLEELLVGIAIQAAERALSTGRVLVHFNVGPRNDPARLTLERLSGFPACDEEQVCLGSSAKVFDRLLEDSPASIEIIDASSQPTVKTTAPPRHWGTRDFTQQY